MKTFLSECSDCGCIEWFEYDINGEPILRSNGCKHWVCDRCVPSDNCIGEDCKCSVIE